MLDDVTFRELNPTLCVVAHHDVMEWRRKVPSTFLASSPNSTHLRVIPLLFDSRNGCGFTNSGNGGTRLKRPSVQDRFLHGLRFQST